MQREPPGRPGSDQSTRRDSCWTWACRRGSSDSLWRVPDDAHLAKRYRSAATAASASAVDAEPEAQLTAPVKELFEALGTDASGDLTLVREAQLDGVRPDFAGLFKQRPCGWIELKAPERSVDTSKWRGREAKQWSRLAELDSLIVCNGELAQLYLEGVPAYDPAILPLEQDDGWDSTDLRAVLLRFREARPATITRVSQLAMKLAPMTRLLRDRVRKLLDAPGETAMRRGLNTWATHVHNGVDSDGFSNDLAQVIAYSLAMAALRGDADSNGDHRISLEEARHSIEGTSPVLSAALGPVLGVPGLLDDIKHEVGAIERLASVVDAVAVANSKDPRGEPWLWFYEDFLQAFDPEARKRSGVYYTPTSVVQAQVRQVEYILRSRFKRKLGFADKSVVTLDPACGSGTYPLAVIDRAVETAISERGSAGPAQIAPTIAKNLIAFELMPGPYAVAHLRVGQRIAEAAGGLVPPEVRVYLSDTLDDPEAIAQSIPLWGDADVLAEERRRAQTVKRDQEVMVAIGNPPYDRVNQASGAGGWVVSSGKAHSLFDDILKPASNETIFSHIASLYNLYVYFWRWAIWKVFESSGDGPAVVSFITASSWLTGPGFIGLRQLTQSLSDEIWICDLGGDNRGTQVEDNVFDIETPVAIVTLIRKSETKKDSAPAIRYRRVSGTRAEKLSKLDSLKEPDRDEDSWERLELSRLGDVMVPLAGDLNWQRMPALTDLFPWQFPGVKANRTWPISPSRSTLTRRWEGLLERTKADDRAEAFVSPTTGRQIHTKVAGLPPLSSLEKGAPHRPIRRYAFRSFDRQWILYDPRLLALERPALWASASEHQVFLSTMTTTPIGPGPAATVSTDVPDLHHFRGNFGGKDVLPLYRDASASQANVTSGLLAAIGGALREQDPVTANPTPEDLLAYTFSILATPAYYQAFRDGLAQPGLRIPLTRDPRLFVELRDLGRQLLWLQTYAGRYQSKNRPEEIDRHPEVSWSAAVTELPDSIEDVRHDHAKAELAVGNGRLSGVTRAMWEFSVSGLPVIQRWIAYRTRKGYGRAASQAKPLDRIRPSEWEDDWNDELLELCTVIRRTIELLPEVDAKLIDLLDSPLIHAAELPQPKAYERKEPKA